MSLNRPAIPAILPIDDDDYPFPVPERALKNPNGLLALGGSLRPRRLLSAYRQGIFPWYSEGQPVLWWSPDPRLVLFPEKIIVRRSLAKAIRNRGFEVTIDRAFTRVLRACAEPRPDQDGTWITAEIFDAYTLLHYNGLAHSFETWLDGELVGGLYGVSLGKVFFGESMFSKTSDASKVAFVKAVEWLKSWGYELVDCQVTTEHLLSLGAEEISRSRF
ncbi:MAG: leucyl/phenylalanyl-tRNA--protein transferase, partial [Gammaproteobacteria bacterium]|nr:leucyl/phenylalanyl-tRNA--protein transferase [Gammaproteobacteria bacterium]